MGEVEQVARVRNVISGLESMARVVAKVDDGESDSRLILAIVGDLRAALDQGSGGHQEVVAGDLGASGAANVRGHGQDDESGREADSQ